MKRLELHNLEKMDYGQREAYNTLRTNLRFCGTDVKTVMLTSCTRNEGKSTVAFDLARSLAEGGKRTLLIDADLRKSVYLSRFRVTYEEDFLLGLSHYLSGQDEMEDVIYLTNIENLSVIMAGSLLPNPTELLASARFEKLMKTVGEKYDMVIVDTPPLGAVIDAAVMAPMCDGTLFVLEDKSISRRFVKEVLKQLRRTGCRILGIVLNKTDPYNGKYYGKYGKYGKYKKYGKYSKYGRYSKYYKYYGSYYD